MAYRVIRVTLPAANALLQGVSFSGCATNAPQDLKIVDSRVNPLLGTVEFLCFSGTWPEVPGAATRPVMLGRAAWDDWQAEAFALEGSRDGRRVSPCLG